MLSPKLYKNSHAYDRVFRLLAYERSIDRFLRSLELDLPPHPRILDAGCGTGLIGLHFLARYPAATLVATDLEANFLGAVQANARRKGLDLDRITLGTANISRPQSVVSLAGESRELADASFDLICVGAVLGYADDSESSIQQLLKLLVTGGYLINLEMNEGVLGRLVSKCYHYRPLTISMMQDVIRSSGGRLLDQVMGINHLPARLTRTAIVARKDCPYR